MAQAKATVKGRGPELFGRGIDLLFGDEELMPVRAPVPGVDTTDRGHSEAALGDQEISRAVSDVAVAGSVENGAASPVAFTEADVDQFLRMAAEAFLRVQSQKMHRVDVMRLSRNASVWEADPIARDPDQDDTVAEIELDVPPLPDESFDAPQDSAESSAIQPVGDVDQFADFTHDTVGTLNDGDAVLEVDLDVPPLPEQQDLAKPPTDATPAVSEPAIDKAQPTPAIPQPVLVAEEDSMPDQPASTDSVNPPVVSENGQPRKVAPPGVTVSGPATALDGGQNAAEIEELPATLIDRELPAMSRKEIEEILERLPKSDLRALDKQIDQLYEDVTVLFSGKRREITVAFEVLRKARIILLKDPEHFAEAEYYVRQVQARVHQVRQSIDEGGRYWPRILAYQTAWLVVLAIVALITTVNGASFERWIAYLLGVPIASESVGWAILFISTLAWGGIGGATSAMWSLYYHISVQRDYEPIENLWYYTQPLIGMVLGGIVFLIMGAGFLVVETTPTVGAGSMGARLVPAVIAVIAGFRQTVVLDLIERIVGLIAPVTNDPRSDTPTEELSI